MRDPAGQHTQRTATGDADPRGTFRRDEAHRQFPVGALQHLQQRYQIGVDDAVGDHPACRQCLCRTVECSVQTIQCGVPGPHREDGREAQHPDPRTGYLQLIIGKHDLRLQRRRHIDSPLSTPITDGATH